MSFLMKVDEPYSPIKTNILMLPELPNVTTPYRMLQQEQKLRELFRLNVSNGDSMAFGANKRIFYNKHQTHNKHYK